MNDKNRIYYFMGGTLAVGLLVALVMFLNTGIIGGTDDHKDGRVSNHKELQIKVDELNLSNVSPANYNTLRTEINSSFQAKTITEVWKNNLLIELEQKYSDLTLDKINQYFVEDPVNEAAMQPLIAHLQFLGKGQQEIKSIEAKIKEIKFYTEVLPAAVNKFTSYSFDDFNEERYKSLKSDLDSLPSKNPTLKNRKSVQAVKTESLSKLVQYYKNYVDYNMDMQDVGLDIDSATYEN